MPTFPADEHIGLDSFLTGQAARMATLAGIDEPFRKARRVLEELCGWQVCVETIRKICHEYAQKARQQRPTLATLPQAFDQSTDPDREIHIDAGKVNTPGDWRDIKVAVFASRGRCESPSLEDYEQRDLPPGEPSQCGRRSREGSGVWQSLCAGSLASEDRWSGQPGRRAGRWSGVDLESGI